MSNFKGTKGKWVHSRINAVYALNDECIAITYTNNKEANARLISKAPEMLEMLKKTERTLREVYECDTTEIKQLIKEATEL